HGGVRDRPHTGDEPRVPSIPRGDRLPGATLVDRPAIRRPRAIRRGRELVRLDRLLRVAVHRLRPAPSVADGSGVGEGGARWTGGRPLSLGRGTARGCRLRPAPHRDGNAGEPPRALRALRGLPRVVPRLGRRRLLREVARTRPMRAVQWHAEDLPRWRLATPGPVESGGASLVAAAVAPVLGLRIPRGTPAGPTGDPRARGVPRDRPGVAALVAEPRAPREAHGAGGGIGPRPALCTRASRGPIVGPLIPR